VENAGKRGHDIFICRAVAANKFRVSAFRLSANKVSDDIHPPCFQSKITKKETLTPDRLSFLIFPEIFEETLFSRF